MSSETNKPMRKGLRTKIPNRINQGLWKLEVGSGAFGTQNRGLVEDDMGLEEWVEFRLKEEERKNIQAAELTVGSSGQDGVVDTHCTHFHSRSYQNYN